MTRHDVRHESLGARGEALAEAFLREAGYKIVGRNIRLPPGELDVVAAHGDCLCFIEVKCRRHEPGESFLSSTKQRRMRLLARWYLEKWPWAGFVRFDVIGIEWPPGAAPRVTHIVEAF
ncbi:MAG: YraN family protein [Candidatus Sericytochromatia bacterium]|nr:YraN family protein [Candidatus Sericytochromatia bacterium]